LGEKMGEIELKKSGIMVIVSVEMKEYYESYQADFCCSFWALCRWAVYSIDSRVGAETRRLNII
jgi:hypothetical protein